MDSLFFWRNLDALDLFELLDPALNLLCFRRLIAETVYESFQLLNPLALVAIRGFQLGFSFGLLAQIRLIVATVEVDALVPDFNGPVDGNIQKIAVVRNENVAERVIR